MASPPDTITVSGQSLVSFQVAYIDPQYNMRPTSSESQRRVASSILTSAEDVRPSSQPPPLRVRHILLPELATVPINVHPLLEHHAWHTLVVYDLRLPHFTAHAPSTEMEAAYIHWGAQSALDPSTIGSITIRLRNFDRPVVVLPSRRYSAVLTVDDVLSTVHNVIRAEAMEMLGDQTQSDSLGLWRQVSRGGNSYTEAQIRIAIGEILRERCWWSGIHPSQVESDVWWLYTREGDH